MPTNSVKSFGTTTLVAYGDGNWDIQNPTVPIEPARKDGWWPPLNLNHAHAIIPVTDNNTSDPWANQASRMTTVFNLKMEGGYGSINGHLAVVCRLPETFNDEAYIATNGDKAWGAGLAIGNVGEGTSCISLEEFAPGSPRSKTISQVSGPILEQGATYKIAVDHIVNASGQMRLEARAWNSAGVLIYNKATVEYWSTLSPLYVDLTSQRLDFANIGHANLGKVTVSNIKTYWNAFSTWIPNP